MAAGPGGGREAPEREQARLRGLAEAGLTARSDPDMDRFARMVARLLDVPVALVSLLEPERQVFPGMVGLGDPWASCRETPLTHSLCQYVVASREPLVLADVRADDLTRDSLAIPDMGLVAYAGMPLTDARGNVLGSLCAIDSVVREWTGREVQDLADLAEACSAELRLRIANRQGEEARAAADEARRAAEQVLAGAELQLRAAEELTGTVSLLDVRRKVRELVSGLLKPSYVGLVLLDEGELRRVPDPDTAHAVETLFERYGPQDAFPTARALRERRTVTVPDRAHLVEWYSAEAVAAYDSLGLQSAVCVPLPAVRGPLGVLVTGWAEPHRTDLTEYAALSAVAGYTAQAVERAVFLDDRIDVAHQLQQAMLTTLPEVDGLDMAAVYLPAVSGEMVGGDWYDAIPLSVAPQALASLSEPLSSAAPSAVSGPGPVAAAPAVAAGSTLAITVGDITGHDIHAAAVMGQVRSMLRQAALDHPGQGPAAVVAALERAVAHLPLEAGGTLIHAHLRRQGPAWHVSWTNAGHPPPLLLHADGRVEELTVHDALFHHALTPPDRTDQHVRLDPGATLLLYTDGLVEHRRANIDDGIARAAASLLAHRGMPLPELLSRLTREVAGPHNSDDIVLMALRPAAQAAPPTAGTRAG
ncbi:GAF domain-containing SpoIIE family protein phosphatase [Streptomyces sp. NBC_00669]|uniref:GAF domain-containing SpoIIE family protein phosphatase n=1 Tax=Streptomyces sp. NBC_00669 TaxID=2976011 RepID=UPI002E329491|nr:SpoIIE family protein phosphatase [Streptomyces sp. NBC_00669]